MVKFKVLAKDEKIPTICVREIKTHNIRINTPIRGLSKSSGEVTKNFPKTEFISEAFIELSLEKVKEISKNRSADEEINKKLSAKLLKNKLNVIVTNISNGIPTLREVEYFLHILNFENINDNFVSLPFPKILIEEERYDKVYTSLETVFSNFGELIDSFEIKRENELGYIPLITLGGEYLEKLFDFFTKKLEITNFVIDMGGKNIERVRGQISVILKKKREITSEYGNCFFYLFNTMPGLLRGDKKFIPARDFLSVFVGFDCFGPSHKRLKIKKEVIEKIKEREKSNLKLFDKKEYIYHVKPRNGKNRLYEKRYNALQHLEELDFIKTTIIEKGTFSSILRSKKNAFPIIEKILRARNRLLTQKLAKFIKL